MSAQNEKADERANAHRPNDLSLREEAQTADSVAVATQSVKRSNPNRHRYKNAINARRRELVIEALSLHTTITAAADYLDMERSVLSKLAKRLGVAKAGAQ